MQTGKQTSAPTLRIAAAVLQENRKKKRKRMTEKTEKEKNLIAAFQFLFRVCDSSCSLAQIATLHDST